MKITSVEPILISVPYDRRGGPVPKADAVPWHNMDTLLVRVETSDGITGWGEAFGFGACIATHTALTKLVGPLAVGRDAGDIAALMDDLARKLHNYGRNGPVSFALSGLDIALWDIAGQVAGEPLYRMLGGARITRVPAYASLLRYGSANLVARNAARAMERGYARIKLHEITVSEVAAARKAIGAGTPLMVDTNCPWSADEAIAMARALAPYNLHWLEEPVWPPDDYAALARVRSAGVPIAAGENAGTPIEIAQLIDAAKVDFVQPSATKIGGVSEMQRLIALAGARRTTLAPHSPYFGPGLIATIHICASLPEPAFVERFYCDLEASPFGEQVNAADGYMTVPQGPGLGLDIDAAVIARYRVDAQ
jgi:L-alanine-DL-glutamate epimerase-like enolase superfamily enzyme